MHIVTLYTKKTVINLPIYCVQDTHVEQGEKPFKRLAKLNLPEWKQGCVGILSSFALGLQMPGKIFV